MVRNGFKLSGTALFRILKAQAIFERGTSSKRTAENVLEDVLNDEPEGTPRKLNKSESNVSVTDPVDDKETDESDENFEVFDDTDLSVNLPAEESVNQVTVIEQASNARTAEVKLETSVLELTNWGDIDPNNVEFQERVQKANEEYLKSQDWLNYIAKFLENYYSKPNRFGIFNIGVSSGPNGYLHTTDAYHQVNYLGPATPENLQEYQELLNPSLKAKNNPWRQIERSRSPINRKKMTRTEGEEVDVLKDIKFDMVKDEEKIDSLGEIIKRIGGKGKDSYDEKVKAFENLTTGSPLNGREKWDIVIKDMKEACIERTSVLVEPTFYFGLKFLLQLTTTVDRSSKMDKTVLAIKSRLKILMLAY